MRKLIFSLLAFCLLLVAPIAYALDSPTFESWTDKSRDVGKYGNSVRVLKLVRVASADPNATTYASGDVVIYSIISDDGVTITYAEQSADGAIAGILATSILTADADSVVAADDAGRRNWGWMIVHGPATARAKNGTTNGNLVGDPFVTSRDPSFITSHEGGTNTGGVFSYDAGVSQAGNNARNLRLLKAASNTGGFFMDAERSEEHT